MHDCDWARSILTFDSDGSRHTPRLQLDAACTLTVPGEEPREYVLTAPCIGERMYRPSGLIFEPTVLFSLTYGGGDEFLMEKWGADAGDGVREAHRVGEAMSTNDGRGATVKRIDLHLRRYGNMRRLETPQEIRAAIQSNSPINGRTTCVDQDGRTSIQLDYPVKCCNWAHDHGGWQVDTGPVLMPDPDAEMGDLPVSRLNAAYIVYNSADWAEVALRRPTSIRGGGRTPHFVDVIRMENVRNELFAAE